VSDVPAPKGAFTVAPNACSSCPYLRATPPGVWDANEYAKLKGYDRELCLLPPFMCHSVPTRDGLCVGWLAVHGESIPVRLLMFSGRLKPEQVPEPDEALYYSSGREACAAGLAGVKRPPLEACLVVNKIMVQRGKRAGRNAAMQPTDVECPRCKVAKGKPCRAATGKSVNYCTARLKLAGVIRR
jgi:hypothetical protein